jgi:hypothetical protein
MRVSFVVKLNRVEAAKTIEVDSKSTRVLRASQEEAYFHEGTTSLHQTFGNESWRSTP